MNIYQEISDNNYKEHFDKVTFVGTKEEREAICKDLSKQRLKIDEQVDAIKRDLKKKINNHEFHLPIPKIKKDQKFDEDFITDFLQKISKLRDYIGCFIFTPQLTIVHEFEESTYGLIIDPETLLSLIPHRWNLNTKNIYFVPNRLIQSLSEIPTIQFYLNGTPVGVTTPEKIVDLSRRHEHLESKLNNCPRWDEALKIKIMAYMLAEDAEKGNENE